MGKYEFTKRRKLMAKCQLVKKVVGRKVMEKIIKIKEVF
jgi:hypothetical protein